MFFWGDAHPGFQSPGWHCKFIPINLWGSIPRQIFTTLHILRVEHKSWRSTLEKCFSSFTLKFTKVFHHLSAWAHRVIGDAAVLQKILISHLVQEICLPWNSSSGNSRFKLKGLKPCGHWNLQRSSKYEKHMVTIMIQLTFAVRLGWYRHLLLKCDRPCFFSRHTYCMSTRFISILHNVCTCVQ